MAIKLNTKYFFFTVDVEEWFTSTKILPFKNTNQFAGSSNILNDMHWILDLLNRENAKGTFFFISTIATKYPELVKKIIDDGHEIALHGESHKHLSKVSNTDFALMLSRSKQLFKKQFNVDLKGYRAPYFSIHEGSLAELKKSGFKYDSSVVPCLPIPGWYGTNRAPKTPYKVGIKIHETDNESKLMEFPMSVHPTLRIPGLGGYYFRNLGFNWSTHILKSCIKKLQYSMFYLHPWELSSIPKMNGIPFYMSRNTGDWTKNAIIQMFNLLKKYNVSINNTLHNFYNNNI